MRRRIAFYSMMVLLVLASWQCLGARGGTVRLLVSSPSLAYGYGVANFASLWESASVTLAESFCGLALAAAISFMLMIGCLYFPSLMELVLPILLVTQVIPLVTLAPLLILLFGIGVKGKVVMSALLCFFPIFINFARGVQAIPGSLLEILYVYDASSSFRIFRVFFPLSTPNIMTGLKISSTLAVIGAIVGEFNGAEVGLGKNLFLAAKRLEPEMMICSLFFSAALSGLLYGLILIIAGRWYLCKS